MYDSRKQRSENYRVKNWQEDVDEVKEKKEEENWEIAFSKSVWNWHLRFIATNNNNNNNYNNNGKNDDNTKGRERQ